MEGIVLETYGSGNAPSNLADLLEEFSKATERGVIMVNCTQCLRGSVITKYATGKVPPSISLLCYVPPLSCDMSEIHVVSNLSTNLFVMVRRHSSNVCRYYPLICSIHMCLCSLGIFTEATVAFNYGSKTLLH